MTVRTGQLVRVNSADAARFIEQYEHLGSVGLGVWHWGLSINEKLASVLSFGVPCFAPNRGFLALVSKQSGARLLQLCRGATAFGAPRNVPSRIIALALQQIYRDFGPSLIVAYADVRYSEVGTIYQASNAIYTGLTDPKGQANYLINGRLVSGWIVRKRYGTRSKQRLKIIDPDLVVVPLEPKFRYILPAGSPRFRKHVRRILQTYQESYPKRIDLGIGSMNIARMVNVQGPLHEFAPCEYGCVPITNRNATVC
jgi:hypothetical protein